MNKFLEAIHDMIEIITGERPKQETERAKGFTKEETQMWLDSVREPKRARGKKGKFLADDKSTPDVNEAYSDGRTPKKKVSKKKTPAKRGRGRPKGSKNKSKK